MRGCKYWRQAIRLSVLMHCLLIAGIGFLSSLTSALPAENEYIEMELGDYNPAASEEMISDITQRQLSSLAFVKVAEGQLASNIRQAGVKTNSPAIQGDEGEQSSTSASTNRQADYGGGSSEPEFAGGKQSASGIQTSGSTERSTIQPPHIIQKKEPVYPDEARRQGLEGKVMIKLEVLPNGRIGSVSIERSSGYESLDAAAVEAVRHWRFNPAKETISGSSVRCTTTVPIIFRFN
ncbi:hypothetical protein SDC9_04263 [bioreactor metagenome]|uniref:TonB C-terminal domain-containing protein n=1 Tax=bioreactor metagenome TaxID=1076179 RepID=A0A644SYJ8_9ZZZZ